MILGLTTNESITLAISVLSLALSAFVSGWTIYRDAIQKPKFRVSVAAKSLYFGDGQVVGPHIYVEALNMGPIPNRVGLVFGRPGWFSRTFRGKLSGYVTQDHTHPGATANAQRVEIGDTATFVFPIESEMMSAFVQVGVTDGYGRVHWCSRRAFRTAKRQVEETKLKVKAGTA